MKSLLTGVASMKKNRDNEIMQTRAMKNGLKSIFIDVFKVLD